MPIVSVFTPAHTDRFLRDAYASLQAQTFTDWEWIVLRNNGCPTVAFDDPRVKVYEDRYLPPWVGALKAKACSLASGDILVELDHDDLLMPTALAEVAAAFIDPTIGFAYSNTIYAGYDPATGRMSRTQRFDERFGWRYREVQLDGQTLDEHIAFPPTPDSLSRIWFAPNHLRAFRRSAYEQVGGYSAGMRVLDDQDLMCRLYLSTGFRHIDRGLYVYRVHGENTWLRNNAEIQQNVDRMYEAYAEPMAERWADLHGLRKIELGGRFAARTGYETLDLKDADIISDLNERWPFEDGSVGILRSFDVFEHLKDSIHTMKEAARVLAPGGWLIGQVPSTDGRGAFQDPTHVSFWNENSFAYYTDARKARYIDTPVRFQAARVYTTPLDEERVCWVRFHLLNLAGGYRPAGELLI